MSKRQEGFKGGDNVKYKHSYGNDYCKPSTRIAPITNH